MSKFFYAKLAVTNIQKSKQLYYPYMLTCIFTVMLYYITHSISYNEGLAALKGADAMRSVLYLGAQVVAIFSFVFLLYTNSFLMKKRTTELGLYNILGLEKRHIQRILLLETLFIMAGSLIAGLAAGMLFSRLMFLWLLKILGNAAAFKYEISIQSIGTTIIIFCIIFLITALYNIIKVRRTNAIDLLKSSQQGEREPKTKIIMSLLGVLALAGGYGIALKVKSPLSAINLFFVAVLLVMAGTYCLFTSGSIFFLKLLKKNSRFYYKINHFTTVSQMLYRMKQNAAGLSNICILSTAVLVIVSATASLYFGQKDVLEMTHPYDVMLYTEQASAENMQSMHALIDETAQELGVEIKDQEGFDYARVIVDQSNDVFTVTRDVSLLSAAYLQLQEIVSYNQEKQMQVTLEADEVLIEGATRYPYETITIQDRVFRVKETAVEKQAEDAIVTTFMVYLRSKEDIKELALGIGQEENEIFANSTYFNIEGSDQQKEEYVGVLRGKFKDQGSHTSVSSLLEEMEIVQTIYGGFLFIGIYLGVLFVLATALIIYYKQISEGYQDKDRFRIMQNIGMGKSEVQKTIFSQILIVFFLPLVMAVIHLCFAFSIIRKLLVMFGLFNTSLFVICTVVVIAVFTVIYGVIYMVTAKSYYKIVNSRHA